MKIKLITVGLAMAAMLMDSSYAAQTINWTETYTGTVDQLQTNGVDYSYPLDQNIYGWTRAVSAWQSFQAGVSGDLGGVSINLNQAASSGSVDFNIYAGTGVLGTLLESVTLQWNNSFYSYPADWYTIQLNTPVPLTAGNTYTFSFENLSANQALRYVVDPSGNPYPAGEYMQQGYFWGATSDYKSGTTTAAMNFETVMAAPEPSSVALCIIGGFSGLLLCRRKRRCR